MSDRPSSPVKAALWMLGSLASFTAMAIASREIAHELSTFQIMALRSIVGIVTMVLVLSRVGWHHISTKNLPLHLCRNITSFGGQFSWFYAISYIPLAAVFSIEFTTPIWTALFSSLMLGERITARRSLAIVLGLAGVLIILRPGMTAVHPASLVMLFGAMAFALSYTLTKRITQRDGLASILFFMTIIQLPLGLIPALFNWMPLHWGHLLPIMVIGLTGLTAHYCLARALSHADTTVVIPMDFLRLPIIALLGFLFYNESVDRYLVLGAALVLCGNSLNLLRQRNASSS